MLLKEYWFRELYLGLKVTASFDRSESYTRVIDGQVRCITRNQATEPAGHLERAVYHSVCAGMDDPSSIPQPAQRKHQKRKFRQCYRRPVGPPHLV